MSRPAIPAIERFWPQVDAEGDCWEWQGTVGSDGYGRFSMDGRTHNAHRAAWLLMVGPLPKGIHVDHRCRNRRCVNPDHLEPTTPRVNTRRSRAPGAVISVSGMCGRGIHRLGGDNVFPSRAKIGSQQCRQCALDANAEKQTAIRGRPPLPPPAERTHCPKGHPYSPENTYVGQAGKRYCRPCNTAKTRERRAAKRTGKERGTSQFRPIKKGAHL